MNRRILSLQTLGLGATLLLATACGSANTVSPTTTTAKGAATAAATMTPAEMAAFVLAWPRIIALTAALDGTRLRFFS